MSDEKTATLAKDAVASAVRYKFSEIKDASEALFGHAPAVVDGAFFGKDKEASYTVKEAQDLVKAFLNKPIGTAKKEGE